MNPENPLDPTNSPNEKLVLARQRMPARRDLETYLRAEGIDPSLAVPLGRAFQRFDEDRHFEYVRLLDELERWSNRHTHPVADHTHATETDYGQYYAAMGTGPQGAISPITDGITWSTVTPPAHAASIVWSPEDSLWLIGYLSTEMMAWNDDITNDATWTDVTVDWAHSGGGVREIIRLSTGTWLACGGNSTAGTIYRSTGGPKGPWTKISHGITNLHTRLCFFELADGSILCGGNSGSNGTAGSGVPVIIKSTDDGVTWAEAPSPEISSTQGLNPVSRIATSDGGVTLVATGTLKGHIGISEDGGATWTCPSVFTNISDPQTMSVDYVGGRWVVCGNGPSNEGYIAYSDAAVPSAAADWTELGLGVTGLLYDVTFYKDAWFSCGAGNQLWRSDDGATWTSVAPATLSSTVLRILRHAEHA